MRADLLVLFKERKIQSSHNCPCARFTCNLKFWSDWRCRDAVIRVGVPSRQCYCPRSDSHSCAARTEMTHLLTQRQILKSNICRKKSTTLKQIPSSTHLDSPVIQVGVLGPVQGVRGDAVTSCDTPGTSNYGQSRTLSQAVYHRLGQLCLLHHVLDLLQLLVIGSPPGSCCYSCGGGGGGGLACTSYSTCRAWRH